MDALSPCGDTRLRNPEANLLKIKHLLIGPVIAIGQGVPDDCELRSAGDQLFDATHVIFGPEHSHHAQQKLSPHTCQQLHAPRQPFHPDAPFQQSERDALNNNSMLRRI